MKVDGVSISRVVGTVVVKLEGIDDRKLGEEWGDGPLPLDWFGHATDAALRSSYLEMRAASILYGVDQVSLRRHRFLTATPEFGSIQLLAVELLAFGIQPTAAGHRPPTTVFAVAHLDVHGDDPIGELSRFTTPPVGAETVSELGIAVTELLGSCATAAQRGRRVTSAFLFTTPEGVSVGAPSLQSLTQWSRLDGLLWLSASLTPTSRYPPDQADPALLSSRVRLSQSWQALALRDGVGFVSTDPDNAQFTQSQTVLVRSVYTDVLLLAHLQREELRRLANDLASIDHRSECAAELTDLVDRMTVLRNKLWWDDLTAHGHGNDLLRATHEQLRMQQLFARVNDDLGVFRDEVDSRELRVTRKLQEDESKERQRLEVLVKRAGAAVAGVTLALGILNSNIAGLTADTGIDLWAVLTIAAASALAGWGLGWTFTRQDQQE